MNEVEFLNGTISDLEREYKKFLEKNVTIISTALSKDFERYGHCEYFLLIVTYKKNDTTPD